MPGIISNKLAVRFPRSCSDQVGSFGLPDGGRERCTQCGVGGACGGALLKYKMA